MYEIRDTAFGEVWHLLDIVSTLSDRELCEPGLIFWLVEELLDSQTIDGCRTVFDYLDSRRDRLTSKHFKEKSLIILRTCNELLRRLSRAEDTVFCGRVFIFLFQSFPLGDKSSVNLRGEYHVENVTTYEILPPSEAVAEVDGMDVDKEEVVVKADEPAGEDGTPSSDRPEIASQQIASSAKTVKFEAKVGKQEEPEMDMDALYATFWSLQEFFSQPTKLFDDINLETFKKGLQATMRKFKEVQMGSQPRGATKPMDESRRGVKRKRGGQEDEISSAFNPKYLTSRDLFDLEINDLAFRRHIMVQSLIIVDFLLSLNPKSKKKLELFNNRAVQYSYTLNEDNTKWATDARADISFYLMQGPEGKFYYRMVDTVLSRDKNWTHWKAESCPPIERPPIPPEDFSEAMKGAQRTCTNKRLRSVPLGTLDPKFLNETGSNDGMERLKDPRRYAIPTAESFERPIADDQFEIEMVSSTEEKQIAEDAKASKLWRTLRIASKNALRLFDKIDDGKNLDALFRPEPEDNSQRTEINGEEIKENTEAEPPTESSQKSVNIEAEVSGAVAALGGTEHEMERNGPVGELEQKTLVGKAMEEPVQEAPLAMKGKESLEEDVPDSKQESLTA